MFHSSHDWPCKLLLMCHWLELFIERDELGHEGVEFDLWQCIWGLKTPPHWELCVFVHGAVLQYVRVHVCACVRLPREYNNSQQTQRLLCSFEAPRMKKLSWEINKSGVMLSQAFSFLLLMAQEVFNHVPFFFFVCHLAPQRSGQPNQTHWWATSVILSMLVFIFLPFTVSQLQCLINPSGAVHAGLHSPQLLPWNYLWKQSVSTFISLLQKKCKFFIWIIQNSPLSHGFIYLSIEVL